MPRKKSIGPRYARIRTTLVEALEEKKVYSPTDDIIIDELLFNMKLADQAKEDIEETGIRINTVRNPMKDPYYQVNPSVNTYQSSVKIISALLTKLGITVQERQKLGLQAEDEDQLSLLFDDVKTTRN